MNTIPLKIFFHGQTVVLTNLNILSNNFLLTKGPVKSTHQTKIWIWITNKFCKYWIRECQEEGLKGQNAVISLPSPAPASCPAHLRPGCRWRSFLPTCSKMVTFNVLGQKYLWPTIEQEWSLKNNSIMKSFNLEIKIWEPWYKDLINCLSSAYL